MRTIFSIKRLLFLLTAFLFSKMLVVASEPNTSILILDDCGAELSVVKDDSYVVYHSDSACMIDCSTWADGTYSAKICEKEIIFEIKDGIITNRHN